ncbi:hypothetical protein T552_03274 [Pneumocystis carinii B80]|uniref:DNA-directed RNA polymerase subunit n=1 Tax=Pneumocystis carinii (strain B80) TaxID=1408658 RepID=A0A0W4ZC58_PNEC8|nr:hypothetical protein T552_03274 [Pneumocystis carinii B80]KTW26002.1 hypothetical protein T552_03274 [Pneumocystis carinii B80]
MTKEHKKSKKRRRSEVDDNEEEKKTGKKGEKKEKKEKLLEKSRLKPKNPFYTYKIELYVSIPPIYSGSPMKGVEYYLDTMILNYFPDIQGIMLAYRNCEFIEEAAKIYYESPFAFSWVRFEMLVWKVKRGDYLEGIINMQSPSHIGLLVSGFFNASIPKNGIPKTWFYQEIMSQKEVEQNKNGYWIDEDKKVIKIGDRLSFWTVKLETIGDIVSIEGRIQNEKMYK